MPPYCPMTGDAPKSSKKKTPFWAKDGLFWVVLSQNVTVICPFLLVLGR